MTNKFPLTKPQYNIWVESMLNPESSIHNIGGQVNIKGDIKPDLFNRVINSLLKNNDSLRLQFFIDDNNTPFQVFRDYEYHELPFFDFSSEEDAYGKANMIMIADFKKCFDINDPKLYKFLLFKITDDHYIYFCKFHHIIMDGWSISLSVDQLRREYNTIVYESNIVPEQTYSYTNFIENDLQYINSTRYKKSEEYWKRKFTDRQESGLTPLLFKNNVPAIGESARKGILINSEDYLKLEEIGAESNVPISTVFLSIIYIYLNKITKLSDIIIGIPLLNRPSKSLKKTIGLFTETSPLLVTINDDDLFKDLLLKVSYNLGDCYRHQRFPVAEIGNLTKTNSLNKLFDVVFSYEKNNYNESFLGYKTIGIPMVSVNQSNALVVRIMENQKGKDVEVYFDYRLDVFDSFIIDNLTEQFQTLYRNIILKHESSLRELSIISEKEKIKLLNKYNSTDKVFKSYDKTIIEQFEDQVLLSPETTALIFENRILTYKELNKKANIVAHYLRDNANIKADNMVGLLIDRSEKMIIALLGILKSGAAYVPIDPTNPKGRINYIVNDCKPVFTITNENIESILDSSTNTKNPIRITNTNSLLYVIYTSGTTGNPKGTLITNKNYNNYISWAKEYYFEREDQGHFGLFTSLSFDLTTTSIFLSLLRGKSLTIYNQNREISDVLYEMFNEGIINSVKLTPSHISLLREIKIKRSNVELLIVGGEELLNEHVKVLKNIKQNMKVFNEYGPTETTVGCIVKQIEDEKIVIGTPIANTKIYILDDYLTPLPVGIPGEIYICGTGVGAGYLNKPELSKEKFLPNPFISGDRIYKTGDLGRWLNNGDIEFLGRIDNQIKINGYRIELGEIENRLLQFDGLNSCTVSVNKNKDGDKYIAAYFVSNLKLKASDIRTFLRNYLPDYMIPHYFIQIEKVPLTSNGKVDRDSLPNPQQNGVDTTTEYASPRNEVENILVDIWTEVLDLSTRIGIDDNFFELGGDSIKAIQIVSRLKQKGFNGRASDMLDSLTIRDFTTTISKNIRESEQTTICGKLPLTPVQNWFFNDLDCPKHHYNQGLLLEFEESFSQPNINALKDSIATLLRHHDTLRMSFKIDNKSYIQENRADAETFFEEFDLKSETEPLKKLEELANGLQSSFDLENDTLIRFALFYIHGGARLLIISHHLIIDGVSWRILLEDLESGYTQALTGSEIKLPSKTTSYKKWSERLVSYSKSSELKNVSDFWNSIKDEEDDFNYGVLSKNSGKKIATASLDIEDTTNLLKRTSKHLNAGITDILLTALVKALAKRSEKKSVLIDLESHGRSERFTDIDLSRTIGWFTSIYPVLLDISNSKGIEEEITSIREILGDIPDYGIGYGILKYNSEELKSDNAPRILFNYLGQFDYDTNTKLFRKSSDSIGHSVSPEAVSRYDLSFNGIITNSQFSITLESHLYEMYTLDDILNSYMTEIKKIIEAVINKSPIKSNPENNNIKTAGTKKQRIRI